MRVTTKGKNRGKSFVQEYEERPHMYENISLRDYWYITKRKHGTIKTIPHFVGLCSKPTFPVTQGYARHVLVVNQPWREYPTGKTGRLYLSTTSDPKAAQSL